MNNTQAIRSFERFTTNIKGLPEGEYLTETLYSDTEAWKVVGRTATTLQLQRVEVERDPAWQPNIVPGGFAGHCTNQNEQTWLYAGLAESECTVRLVKSPYNSREKMWGSKGRRFIANGARRKHDYNF
jgi:hypothetical protein